MPARNTSRQPSTTSPARSAFTNLKPCTGCAPIYLSHWATPRRRRPSTRGKRGHRDILISGRRARSSSSESRSDPASAGEELVRSGFRRKLDPIVGRGRAVPLARRERLDPRRIRRARPPTACVFDCNGDRAGRALAHAGNQICERQRLPLLSRQRFLERIADQVALAGQKPRAGRRESVRRIAAETKESRQARGFHHAVKSLPLEFYQ